MPLFMGSLFLNDPSEVQIEEGLTGVIDDAGELQTTKEQIAATITEQVTHAVEQEAERQRWAPKNKSKKIKTDQAIVLENSAFGFKHPNILDVKLGVRLWADDAPVEKKRRFDKITSETTHKNLGFRIAGMRVFRGSEDASELDDEEYRVYDKDYGRVQVNDENVVDEFRKFIFNKLAGIDADLGKAVCEAFLRDLRRVEDILSRHHSRMYSASLLFVFEGDGPSLRAAIEENNEIIEDVQESTRTTKRIDSGIALEDEEELDEDADSIQASSLPQIFSLKLIDFAHAQWTPEQGPDENTLTGVRSLIRIFEEMAS